MGCCFEQIETLRWRKGMRAVTIAAGLLLAMQVNAEASTHFVSPDRRFEAYTTPNAEDGTGMKLFLRRAKTRTTGILVFENMRWIEAKWSPDSRFLAVVDHNDGHIADVYVFRVRAADATPPQIALHYHTPNPGTYDGRWDVAGWRSSPREIVLTMEGGTRVRIAQQGRKLLRASATPRYRGRTNEPWSYVFRSHRSWSR